MFILLSITIFTLRTLAIFQIIEYDFVNVYVDDNTTERTPVQNAERRDAISGFDIIEWICKKKSIR